MQESAIMQLVTQIETSVAQRKLYNYGRYSREYIPFGFEGDLWQARETVGYRENIQRIPASCFMTVELCHPAECVSEYMLATYTPCQLPLMKKCTAYYGDREEEELHRHDYYEMIYVYQGMRTTMIEDQEIVLREKELCIFDTRCAHLDIRSKSEGIAFYLCLNEKQIDGYFLNLLENKQVRDFFVTDEKQKTGVSYLCLKAKPENQTAVEDCIVQSFRELEASMAGTERMVQIFTLRLLNQYPAEAASDLYVCRKKQRGSLKFQSLSAFIHDNIATVSLERLTEEFHYQADYYNRIILKNTGVTYSEYVRRVRMEKAKRLLVSTNLPVQKILLMLGYQCHSYFYGVFRKETGMSPLEYRNAHKGSIKS